MGLPKIRELFKQGDTNEGISLLNDYISEHPNDPDALAIMAKVAAQIGQVETSRAAYKRLIAATEPGVVEHQNALVTLVKDYHAAGELIESVIYAEQLAQLRTHDLFFRKDFGLLLARIGRVQDSTKAFEQLIPAITEAIQTARVAYQNLLNPPAGDSFQPALSNEEQTRQQETMQKEFLTLNKLFQECMLYIARNALKSGNLLKGFNAYVYRHDALMTPRIRMNDTLPLWNGNDSLEGRIVICTEEQDPRETLLALRFLPLLKELRAVTYLMTTNKSTMFFDAIRYIDQVVKTPQLDIVPTYQIPLLDLANTYREEMRTAARRAKHEVVDIDRIRELAESSLPPSQAGSIRVAFSLGNPLVHQTPQWEHIAPILEQFAEESRFDFVCFTLQEHNPEPPTETNTSNEAQSNTKPHEDTLTTFLTQFPSLKVVNGTDWCTLCASILECDLIIGDDGIVSHFACLLSKPTWVMQDVGDGWWWQSPESRAATHDELTIPVDQSIFFPTAKLFPQTEYGEWEDVISSIAEQLAQIGNKSEIPMPNAS